MKQHIHQLLRNIGPGRMTSTAYDTAWTARLVDLDESTGEQALEWLRKHQLPDGTWGASRPRYNHDRLICTLAAMIALARYGNSNDKNRVRRARTGIEMAMKGTGIDPVGETIGFELLLPTLMSEAGALGLMRRQSDISFTGSGQTMALRTHKLKTLVTEGRITRNMTMAFSSEMAGKDNALLLDPDNLQEVNGSVGHSPSATAYFASYVRRGDPAALAYLRRVASDDGGAPDVAPFDVFERSWTLWNLGLAGSLSDETLALCQPHLDFLEATWQSGRGIGFAAEYTPNDSDVTSLVYEVLLRFGRFADSESLLRYEENNHFRCYRLEANPSISANIHVLGALRQAGFEAEHPSVQKILRFLREERFLDLFWFDKWHASPYYPTAHAVIVAAGYADDLVAGAVDWILETQRPDGSWGYYIPTAEETAYCLQALILWKRSGKHVPVEAIKRGLIWLTGHQDQIYIPLWVGKCLYSPYLVNRSAVLSALTLGKQGW